MLRCCDIILAFVGLLLTLPLMLVVFLIGTFDTGSPFFVQVRVGRGRQSFRLVKFRTMRVGTAQVASHDAPASAITPFGRFLRRSKIDELPQLWNVLWGQMSMVGPRPCLPSQSEVIIAREQRGVFAVRPGITGLAQIQGTDMSTPQLLAEVDARMIAGLGLTCYSRCILLTILGKGRGDRVRG